MNKTPVITCDGWKDGENIPIAYSARREPNIQPPDKPQPENRKPVFRFTDTPIATKSIALVVHDILDGVAVDGERPGWTHYTAVFSPEGFLLTEGKTSETIPGWVGPYPEVNGEYHCTAYFLSEMIGADVCSRAEILKKYDQFGLATANLIGKYKNPSSKAQ